jgi:hypothetical protein
MTEGQWVRVVDNDVTNEWAGKVGVLTEFDPYDDVLPWFVVFPLAGDDDFEETDCHWFHETHLEPWYNPTDPT